MSTPFTLALIWMLVANVRAMFPSKDHHWRFAYAMIAIGLPILAWLWYENGVWMALVFLLAGMWIMRWPVIYLWRWAKRQFGAE
ncbi:hypothetical protein NBRC116590_05490 [Pelagimonas sp. KU-00592-HH]|uniref:DUF2484 family protein n=1 Tax=Roseobacteraceae TaxID=2854170 RepID=UPI0020CE747B|nr:DUF2484 family protein [Shimia sp. CNT1-13L.2]MCP9481496.1 DUF2484 family protein [Shimia sp. CNT1-13L.2]